MLVSMRRIVNTQKSLFADVPGSIPDIYGLECKMADDNIIVEDAADTSSALTDPTSFITMTIIKAGLLHRRWAPRALGTKLQRNLINGTLITQLAVARSFFLKCYSVQRSIFV